MDPIPRDITLFQQSLTLILPKEISMYSSALMRLVSKVSKWGCIFGATPFWIDPNTCTIYCSNRSKWKAYLFSLCIGQYVFMFMPHQVFIYWKSREKNFETFNYLVIHWLIVTSGFFLHVLLHLESTAEYSMALLSFLKLFERK